MKTFLIFSTVGAAGFLVDFGAFLCLSAITNAHAARIVAFLIAVQATFLLNRHYTFRHEKPYYFIYVIGQAKGFAVNFTVFETAIMLLPDNWSISLLIAFTIGSAAALVFNYLFAKSFAFKKIEK